MMTSQRGDDLVVPENAFSYRTTQRNSTGSNWPYTHGPSGYAPYVVGSLFGAHCTGTFLWQSHYPWKGDLTSLDDAP